MKRQLGLLLLLGFSTSSFAMFCPKGFNQISMGNTIDQVIQQCGTPDGQTTKKVEAMGNQEWSFYVNQPPPISSQPQAAQKMVVTLINGKVANMTVSGFSVANSNLCGALVSVGDSAENVKAACGTPGFINKSSDSNGPKPTEVTEFNYNSTPPMTLIFENGKLKEKK